MTIEPRSISDRLSVAPQITAEDVADLKAMGFRSIICNRPDAEGADQPDFAEIAAAADRHGLMARHIPVVGGQIGDADVAAFGMALDDLPGPTLAYCRTGARSTTLWEALNAGQTPATETKAAG